MLLELVIGEGSVGDVLSYVTREVPGETGSLGQIKFKEHSCSNASVCRDCPDSGNNNDVVSGSEVTFKGKLELEIARTKGCVYEGCGKEGLN